MVFRGEASSEQPGLRSIVEVFGIDIETLIDFYESNPDECPVVSFNSSW
jgi:hypothetical protein